jgi:hypothetical protein
MIANTNRNKNGLSGRAKIIETVQTPLGFFALVVLVVEAILGIVASLSEQSTQTIAVYGMLALIASLVAIVSFMAYKRPEALMGRRPTTRRHSDAPPSMEQVNITSIICVSTAEYDHLGIERDAEILSNTFKGVTLHRKMDLNEFRKQLSTNTFEIVHFLGFVDSQTGDLRFADNETLSPEGFLKLLELCGAKLAFLATCDSLYLAAKLAPFVNVVAASGTVETKRMVVWQDCFYGLLSRGNPLSEAYEVAQTTTDVPMVLLMKRDMIAVSKKAANKKIQPTSFVVG